MTLGAKQASQIHVSASTTSLAAGDYFQVVSLEHNDPSGTHAFGVQLLNGEAKSNDEPSVLESKGFVPGILTGAGMLLVAALLVVGLVVLVQRKVLPCVRRTLGLRPRPQEVSAVVRVALCERERKELRCWSHQRHVLSPVTALQAIGEQPRRLRVSSLWARLGAEVGGHR